jgi:S-adenosyl methyltransferase
MQPDDFPEIDTRTASVARSYDALLGGTDNYEIDRRAAEGLEDLMPGSGQGKKSRASSADSR